MAWHEQFKDQSIWMPVLFCCVETPVLYSEVELVGAAIAVDMVNRERFIAVNSELPHERRDGLVDATLHERWIVFRVPDPGDDCNIEPNDGILVELAKHLQHLRFAMTR